MNNSFKKVVVTGLTLAMVLGGSTAAFADGKGNDKYKGQNRDWKKVFQQKSNGNNNNSNSNKDININNLNIKNLTIKLSFDDIKGGDVEWAARYIASLASKRVFEGYEDGTFQPRKTITRIDAIAAAVRLMGLREEAESAEAKQTNLNFKDANKVQDWAKGYVAVALENDLFEESADMVQPQKEADRLWATTLLIKALKKQDEAKAKMDTKLTFKDANKIPAGSVGYVAIAIEQGLIDGYEDNTFRPERPVTRAEMAKLLDRTGVQLPDNTLFEGSLNSAVSNNTLSLTEDGETYSIELASNVYILRDGVKVNASELRAGDQLRVNIANNQAVFVEVTRLANDSQLPQNSTFSATVNATVNNNYLSLTKDGRTYSIEFASNPSIVRNGQTVAASELRAGDEVSVRTSGGKVIVVEVTKLAADSQLPQNSTFTATVNATVNNNYLSLTKDGRTYSIELASNPSIVRNGQTVAATELRVGDEVFVRTSGGKVVLAAVTTLANDEQTNFVVSGTYNSYTTNSSDQVTSISINKNMSDGSIQNNVYYNTTSNVTFLYATANGTIQGDRSQLTPNRAVELRGSNNVVHTIVIK